MKKVRLQLDTLEVESFATGATAVKEAERGTVQGQMRPNSDWSDCSMDTVCNGPTMWDYTCICP